MTTEGLAKIPTAGLWLGGLCYMLQIYLDFSAYSDMAIGMGLMCGFHYKENFNYPYIASSVTDFGGGGTFRFPPSSGIMCISRWAATAGARGGSSSTCSLCGA